MTHTDRPELTPDQLDGLACIRCGRSFAEANIASVPAGHRERGQVFACAHHVPQVGDTVHYRARVQRGITFGPDGRLVHDVVLRTGTVQAVHDDHVIVGDDTAPEWIAVALGDVVTEAAPGMTRVNTRRCSRGNAIDEAVRQR